MDTLRPVSGAAADVVRALDAWLASGEEPEPLVVETSGSTGAPKRVVLSRRAVLASVEATTKRLGAEGRWVLALPPTYVAGLMVIVRSLVAGHRPILLDGYLSFAATSLGESVVGPPRLTSMVPTQLHRALESATETSALRSCHSILVGGGPIDPSLWERARQAGLPVVATYGSSETAGGCVYDGTPLDGVSVDLGEDGRIRLAGPVLFDGYDGDPGLTAATLVDGWFVTSDLGRWRPDGRLQVLGRVDDVVVSGGVNVPLPAVAARLRAHPAISAVEVLGVPDVEWGQRVVAFTVGAVSLDDVRDFVETELPRAWAPRQLVVLDSLPLLPNGKTDRELLRGLA
ncbi:MAG: AMP-binding protein [Nocardioidaceae bacterium]